MKSKINKVKKIKASLKQRATAKKNIKKALFQDKRYCVGIKGMPGRAGIGIGHRPGSSYCSDPYWRKLVEFIGQEDAQYYIDLGLSIK